jgi:hypothetical protein
MKRTLGALSVLLLLGLLVPPAMASDSTPPDVYKLSTSFRPRIGLHAIPVKFVWGATDASGICQYVLNTAVRRPGQSYGPVTAVPLPTPTTTTAVRWERPSNSYYYSLDAYDCAGNATIGGQSLELNSGRVEESAFSLVGASWTSESQASASGGSVAYATSDGDSASFVTCRIRRFGLVMTKGPDRGSIDIYVDGDLWKAGLSLNSPTVQPRHIVYQFRFGGRVEYNRRIEIVKSGGGRIDLDALVTLSSYFC